MSAPKPRPSAWEWWCYRCGEIRCTSENRPDWEHVRDLGEHGCGTSGAPYGRAIWGHEWAVVAWLAENEKRQGVLWEYLDSIRGLCTEADPYTLDTLPEDAMQLLCVNL